MAALAAVDPSEADSAADSEALVAAPSAAVALEVAGKSRNLHRGYYTEGF